MRTRRRNAPKVGRTGARFPRLPDGDQPQRGPSSVGSSDRNDVGADHDTVSAGGAAADPLPRRDRTAIGLTGARFRRRGSSSELSPDDMTPVTRPAAAVTTAPATPTVGLPNARVHPSVPQAAGTVEWPPGTTDGLHTNPPPAVPSVRPYVLTRGRTRSTVELPVEALVTVGSAAARCGGAAEATLMQLCEVPRSVAEVAALTGIPLGVARVLIGDLAGTGALVVHRTAGGCGPDLALLGRVLNGLRKL
jgi:hypothetical protein